jgi:hypothetical protein
MKEWQTKRLVAVELEKVRFLTNFHLLEAIALTPETQQ